MRELWWLAAIGVLLALCVASLAFTSSDWCARCGCDAELHRHDRTGTDCGPCGREKCPAFKAVIVRRKP